MTADSRGLTNGGGAGAKDSGGQGGAEGSGEKGGDPEIRSGATEDPGGSDGRKEPKGAGGTERRGAARGEESRGMAGRRPTKVKPEGRGSSVELEDRRVTVEARELGAKVEPPGLPAEAEPGPRSLEVEVMDTQAPATLEDGRPAGSHHTDGGLRARGGLPDDSGVGGRSGWEGGPFRGVGTGGHFRGAGALTPSTACVMGTVAGSRTWSDVLGSTSEVILCSVAWHCAGSWIVAGNGSPSSVGLG